MNKLFVILILAGLLVAAGSSDARWGRWGGWGRPGVSFGVGFGSGWGWGGPYRYWGGPGYWGGWGYSRPVYVYSGPSRPRDINIRNNSNVTVTANGTAIQPGANITIDFARFLNLQSSAGNVELQNPTGSIEVFQRSDGSLDANF
jgi:hypothetical protein